MRIAFLLVVTSVVLTLMASGAEPYKVGSQVAGFSAEDQNGKGYNFGPKTKFLLVSFDMGTGKAANEVLDAKGASYLPGKGAIYMANIYGMPGIGRRFALPAMKKYAHRIVLADDKDLLTPYPQKKGKVTVLALSGGKITKITHWDPAKENVDAVLK